MEVARPIVAPIVISSSLKEQTYEALRQAITSMNLYEPSKAPKLDERHLAESLGVSRTPVREALARLEQEGLVQTIPRRGVFVVRKTKAEIIEIVTAWAALESMAARLATATASTSSSGLSKNRMTISNPIAWSARQQPGYSIVSSGQ